jgi:hypothetical protein
MRVAQCLLSLARCMRLNVRPGPIFAAIAGTAARASRTSGSCLTQRLCPSARLRVTPSHSGLFKFTWRSFLTPSRTSRKTRTRKSTTAASSLSGGSPPPTLAFSEDSDPTVTCMQPIATVPASVIEPDLLATVPASVIEPDLHAMGVPFHSMSGRRCRNYRDRAQPLIILPPDSESCEFRRVAPSPPMACTPLNTFDTPEAFCSQTVLQMGLIPCYLCGILRPMYHHHGSGQSVRPSHPSI